MKPHWHYSLAIACLTAALFSSTAAAEEPFETRALELPGRPEQVFSARLGKGCLREARQLLVLSVSGVAPNERHHWTAFECLQGASDTDTLEAIWSMELPEDVVGVDTADVRPDLPGDELLWISAKGVRVLAGDGRGEPTWVSGSGGLPLPARNRGLSRLPVAGDWEATGQPSALLPTTSGARLVSLVDGRRLDIPLPIEADYRTADNAPPTHNPELLKSTLTWPHFARGDDDGDGREDLFALWRFGTWVFRVGEDGLPSVPTRIAAFQPFSDELELRHEASSVRIFVRDVNRDGRVDLIVDRTMGGMLASFASTEIHLNAGDGATLSGTPAARLELEGAIAGVDLIDLDADGSAELFRTALHFNVFQMLRFVVTGRARVDFATLQFDDAAEEGLVETWSESISLEIDWQAGRIAGVFPDARSDLNGDGRPDLIVPAGDRKLAIRLGRSHDGGPGFDRKGTQQSLPLEAGSLWPGDLDGDGLDDLVVFDSREASGRVFVLQNRGVLPGTPNRPRLEASPQPGKEG